jgi:hypothetical protein
MTTHAYSLSATTGTMNAGLGANSTIFAMRLAPTFQLVGDSYSEANQDASVSLNAGATLGVGQSFAGANGQLSTAKFYVKKTGAPTGNAVAKVYDITSGTTYGGSATPANLLATSAVLDVTTLTTSFQVISFTFTAGNAINLYNGKQYFITVEYSGGDGSNNLQIGTDASSPTHGGNSATLTGATWTANAAVDVCFYITEGTTNNTAPINAIITRIFFQYTTIVPFTTPVTAGRALSFYRGAGAAATGGTSIATFAKKNTSSPIAQMESFLGGGASVATTGALTTTNMVFDNTEVKRIGLAHLGTAGANYTYEFFDLAVNSILVLHPGELLAVRNPAAMDAGGTWTLNLSVDWIETGDGLAF